MYYPESAGIVASAELLLDRSCHLTSNDHVYNIPEKKTCQMRGLWKTFFFLQENPQKNLRETKREKKGLAFFSAFGLAVCDIHERSW